MKNLVASLKRNIGKKITYQLKDYNSGLQLMGTMKESYFHLEKGKKGTFLIVIEEEESNLCQRIPINMADTIFKVDFILNEFVISIYYNKVEKNWNTGMLFGIQFELYREDR